MKPVSVLQEWVQCLSFMQQSVLIASIRGPDGIEKNHVSKLLIRWLRRCVLYSAFESKQKGEPAGFDNPHAPGGGSFTGPSMLHRVRHDALHMTASQREGIDLMEPWQKTMEKVVNDYLQTLDAVPHHFQLHFMHAAEIVGYEHPDPKIGGWWQMLYYKLANDMHLAPETREAMNRRLGDFEATWREAEEVVAKGPGE